MLPKKLMVYALKMLVLLVSMNRHIYCFEDARLEEPNEWWYERDGLDKRDTIAIKKLIAQVLQGKQKSLDMGTVRSQLVALIDEAIDQKGQVEQLQNIQ